MKETRSFRIGIDARLWNETGVGRYIRNLVSHIAKIDKKNHYILFFKKSEFDSTSLPGKNFEKRLCDISWHTIQEQMLFPKILEKEQLDLMHFPYFSYPIAYKGKFVITIHDLILHHFATGRASTLPAIVYVAKLASYKFVITYAARHASRIISVSNATRDEIIEHLKVPGEKVIVTHEGFDPLITSIKTFPDKLPKDYFLYVGNAYPHKNVERLIEAFQLYKKNGGVADLVLVGRHDYFYERLKKSVTDTAIHFYSDVTDAELAYLYEHARATILPSLMEGFGLPALEAMSHGCPVIASDIPVLREICKDCAYYVNPLDTKAIAEMLTTVYKKGKNKKRIESGYARVKDFSWDRLARETLRIYESSIGI